METIRNLGIMGIILIALGIIAVGVGIGWYLYMKARYRTVESNEALIITGPNIGDPEKDPTVYRDDNGNYMKVVRGGGHKLKLFQTATRVKLTAFQLEVNIPEVITRNGVAITGKAVASVKIADDLGGMKNYAQQYLGKSQEEIAGELRETLSGNLRSTLSKMTVEEVIADRHKFNEEVTEVAQEQLSRMGFFITSLVLADIKDSENYLENIGRPQIAEVRKRADIAEAENRRETELKTAEVNENVEKERYEREMAIAEVKKEKDLKDASILAETERERAKSEASYDIEKAERQIDIERKNIERERIRKENDLTLQKLEAENKIELERQNVEVRKQQIDADAYERMKKAEAEAKSHIDMATAEAEAIRIKGKAEADAIREEAQAKAENASVLLQELMIKTVPEIAKAVAEPLKSVESIRILDGGTDKFTKNITNMMAQAQDSLTTATAFDFEKVLSQFGVNTTDVQDIIGTLETEEVEDTDVSDTEGREVD